MAVIGLGTDIVEIARLQVQLDKSDKLAQRILTEEELDQFRQHKFPARFLAKRFAAKEAAVKALGTGIGRGIGFQQVEVLHKDSGQPFLQFHGQALVLCEQMGVRHNFISISDEQAYAVATVILES